MDFTLKYSRVKQYLKEGRALRIETVIDKPSDIGVLARLEHLPELVDSAREVNARLLMIERAGQGCAIGSALFERIHQPYHGRANEPEHSASGITCHGPGRLALSLIPAVTGFTNRAFAGRWPDSSAGTTPPPR